MPRKYGYIPTKPDHRDFGLSSLPFRLAPALAPTCFLDAWLGPVRDQGDEGSCTANAGAGDFDFQLRKYDPRFNSNPATAPVMSAAFLYYMERQLNGTLSQGDAGSDGRTSCQAENQFGVCTNATMPYVAGQYNDAPTDAAISEALSYKNGAYHQALNVQDIKSILTSGYCVRVGFAVYSSFESDTGTSTVYQPNLSTEQLLGYHEVLVKGYDDTQFSGAFSVRNSWGSDWGVKGDFWFPYSVMANADIFSDGFIQHLGPPWK
jgi:C1A family cysteine protease